MKTRMVMIVVCVGLLAGTASAAAPMAKRVPSGALVYVGWAGTGGQTFAASRFGQLLKEPALAELAAGLKTLASAEFRRDDERKAFQHIWSMGLIVAQRPIAAIWTGLHETRQSPIPTGAVLIDLGKEKKAFEQHLKAFIDLAVKGNAPVGQATVGSVTYWKVQEGGDPEVSFGFVGDVFFITLGPGIAADIITLEASDSLAADKTFTARMKEVGGDNEQLSMYVDVVGIRKVVEPLMKAEMGRGDGPTPGQIFKALGLSKVQALASATRIIDKGMTQRTKLFTAAPHRGVLMPFAGKALTDADLAHVPADADFAAAANVSAAALWKEIRAVVRAIEPSAEAEMLQGLAQAEKAVGLSLEKDLLANMGDTYVISSAASQGGFLTGTVITIELTDAEAFGAAVTKIEGYFQRELLREKFRAAGDQFWCSRPGHKPMPHPGDCPVCGRKMTKGPPRRARPAPSIETVKVGKQTIRYVALPMGPVPVAPAWTVYKDKLYIAAFPQVLQVAIANDGKDPLTASGAFKACRTKVSRDASMLSYVNTPQIIGQVYNLVLVGWTLGANAGSSEGPFSLKPAWLPAMSKLAHYLPPSISAVSSDKTGIIFEQTGTLPFGGLFGGMGPMGSAVMMAFVMPRAVRVERMEAEVTRDATRAREEVLRAEEKALRARDEAERARRDAERERSRDRKERRRTPAPRNRDF